MGFAGIRAGVDTILTSTTRFIANKKSWKNAAKRAKLEQLKMLLTGALEAQRRVLLKCNAPAKTLDKVVKVEPGVKGNTASGKVTKPATVEGGYVLPVPLFINEGDVIRINTETGEYNDRTATK